ncbi:cob(I)yrinic acid a,c-diamide adenosyltransferase [Thioalkalivibrio thiocyanodenitrificans]|uniref:cob(I)yrinic acid a,c-diamide adenosyltransferase n=1 Tax=Thioalkalivibrio thiocyanodenitrificans TaxID=243063 RepID=UPI0003681A80|nr:cob(I)yrinic acid a,c-diamide adenosyltransferase [Thioalkalivibrio thiocyanodenitrificans]
MGNRLTRIYTRTGDDGTTGLATGNRVAKDSARVEAMGDVDELNSVIGVLLARPVPASCRKPLLHIQHDLFDLGGELSMPGESLLDPERVAWMEACLDELNDTLPPLKEFILPGGGEAAALCHQARAICRRAERRLVHLAREEPVTPGARRYLNRLSDLLFVMARVLARETGEGEVLWKGGRKKDEG